MCKKLEYFDVDCYWEMKKKKLKSLSLTTLHTAERFQTWPLYIGFAQCIWVVQKKLYMNENWSIHSFLTTVPQQADVASNILLVFYKKKRKQNKKIIKYY
jgi:hypothetical protein